MKLSRGERNCVYLCLLIYLFPLLAYQQCHARFDSIAGIRSPKGGRRPRLHVAGRWLVVAYGGLCPQADVIFLAYQHVPLASINWLDSSSANVLETCVMLYDNSVNFPSLDKFTPSISVDFHVYFRNMRSEI